MNDAPHLGMPSEGELIFIDGNNISLSAYKKNNRQVSSSEGEEGILAVAPLVTVGEHISMDQRADVMWTGFILWHSQLSFLCFPCTPEA